MSPKPFREIFSKITNNYRWVPFDPEPAQAPLRLPGESVPESDERPQVDHNVPLPDGFSGRITLHWLARTPVLFGAQVDETAVRGQVYKVTHPQRLHAGPDAPYVIPGSAQRGMIRRLMRIVTKGKVGPYADARPAVRDPDLQMQTVGLSSGLMEPPRAGWLIFDAMAKSWSLRPCDAIPLAHVDPIIAELGLANSREKSLNRLHPNLRQALLESVQRAHGGFLVLSGAMPPPSHGPGGKFHEQVFSPPHDEYQTIPIDADAFQRFRAAYGKIDTRKKKLRVLPDSNLKAWLGHFLHTPSREVEWRKALAGQFDIAWNSLNDECPAARRPDDPPGIPVYFYAATDNRPLVIGMTQIMRLPALHSVADVMARTQPIKDCPIHDWVDALFGFARNQSGWRGRVDFAFAPAVRLREKPVWPPERNYLRLQMLEPRVGNAGLYLRRNPVAGETPSQWEAATYDSATALAAGRKIYPVWTGGWPQPVSLTTIFDLDRAPNTESNPGPAATDSLLKFLSPGTMFQAQIDVHNLTLAELGALLWALALGDDAAFRTFSPGDNHEPPFDGLSGHCHVAGRGRAFVFGNLIPAGICVERVKAHATGYPVDLNAALAAFARALHGYGPEMPNDQALDFLNGRPRLSRLRYLSSRLGDDNPLGTRWPPEGRPFADYRKLRHAAAGIAGAGSPIQREFDANLDSVLEAELAGNILDYGSDI